MTKREITRRAWREVGELVDTAFPNGDECWIEDEAERLAIAIELDAICQYAFEISKGLRRAPKLPPGKKPPGW